MIIEFKQHLATARGNYFPGTVMEVDDARGKELINAGIAERIVLSKSAEFETATSGETLESAHIEAPEIKKPKGK